jgi:hypothetical protein
MDITGQRLRDGLPQYVIKDSSIAMTSSTTYKDDEELVYALVANAIYEPEFILAPGGSTTGDIKTRWSVPSGATGFRWCTGLGSTATSRDNAAAIKMAVHAFSSDCVYGTVSTTSVGAAREIGTITTGATAGNLRLQWAQNTSDATGSEILAGSYLRIRRIG